MMDWIALLNSIINGVVVGALLSLPALAITLVFGIARFSNAATGDLMTSAAYLVVILQTQIQAPFLIASTIAVALSALMSIILYFLVFKKLAGRSSMSKMIASFGAAFVIRGVITFFMGQDQYTIDMPLRRAWNFSGIRILPSDLYVLIASVVALVLAFMLLHLSPIGRKMRAIADNPQLAAASGIRSRRVMTILWLVSGAFCGLGGVLLGVKAVVVPELGWQMLLPMFAGVILGGIGRPGGTVAGTILFSIAQEVSVLYIGSTYKIVLAVSVLILILLVRPQGLFGQPVAAR